MPERYSGIAIFFHWLIAGLIATNVYLGWEYEDAHGLAQFRLLQWHKSVGITILLLSLARLAWRFYKPRPGEIPSPLWQRAAARWTHRVLYLLVIALPLTGWIVVSASPTNIRTLLFGKVPWPHLAFVHDLSLQARKAVEAVFVVVHQQLGYILFVLLALHVAAALKHHFLDRDNTLRRILPHRRLRRGALSSTHEVVDANLP